MYGVDSTWTELRIAVLKEMWASGASASRIAAELGEVSRNSVLGKVHRLKLPKRVQISLPRTERTPRIHKRQRFREVLPQHDWHIIERLEAKLFADGMADIFLHREDDAAPLIQGCTLMELTSETCRWPLWTDAQPERMYCGAPGADLENKRPYCRHHSAVAYTGRRG